MIHKLLRATAVLPQGQLTDGRLDQVVAGSTGRRVQDPISILIPDPTAGAATGPTSSYSQALTLLYNAMGA